jgi:hypothetical protein
MPNSFDAFVTPISPASFTASVLNAASYVLIVFLLLFFYYIIYDNRFSHGHDRIGIGAKLIQCALNVGLL